MKIILPDNHDHSDGDDGEDGDDDIDVDEDDVDIAPVEKASMLGRRWSGRGVYCPPGC